MQKNETEKIKERENGKEETGNKSSGKEEAISEADEREKLKNETGEKEKLKNKADEREELKNKADEREELKNKADEREKLKNKTSEREKIKNKDNIKDNERETGSETNLETLNNITELTHTNLSDFALFLSVMKVKAAYEDVLGIILDEDSLKLKEVKVEQVILNKSGKRAIRLDAWAQDMKERQFDMEMQNDTDSDDIRKRSRFYQGMLDTPILKSGRKTRYRNLPSTVIIFITQDDIFGKDLARYTFSERCEEVPDLPLDDGTKKIFLNMSSLNGSPELVSLLQYMKNTTINNPDITVRDKRILDLDRIVEEVRQSEEWEDVSMNIYEMGIERGKEKGIEEGIEKGMEKGIKKGIEKGMEKGIAAGMKKGIKTGERSGREDGLKALVDSLKVLLPDFESVYGAIIKNEVYAGVINCKRLLNQNKHKRATA